MEIAPNSGSDAFSAPANRLSGVRSPKTHPRKAKQPLLTRDQLDGRTNAAKAFDSLVREVESDLGGADQLTAIERSLVEGFVGATITLKNLNCQLVLGRPIDVADLALSISSMVRVASRLGEQRRARDVTVRSTQASPLRAGLAVIDEEPPS
jgi:hypothetical protein